jgi:hypothetical protein
LARLALAADWSDPISTAAPRCRPWHLNRWRAIILKPNGLAADRTADGLGCARPYCAPPSRGSLATF